VFLSQAASTPESLASRCFAGLESLTLRGDQFTDYNANQFASATVAHTLRGLTSLVLNLSNSPLTAAGLRRLFGGADLTQLRSLGVTSPDGPRLGAEAARALADTVLPQLTDDLCLHGWALAGAGAAAALARARGLTSLRLVYDQLGDSGIRALCEAGALRGLRSLLLSRNMIGPRGARHLAECDNLADVDWLVLHDNPLHSEGVIALADRARFRPRSLFMANTMAGDAGVQSLARSPLLGGVESLQLQANSIGPAGVAALARSTNLGRLHSLDLRGNGLRDEHAQMLTSAPGLGRLKQVTIWG
jgi:hypothetical protein